MRKYVLVIIALVLLSLLSGCINRETSATTKDQVNNRLFELQKQYQDKLSQGYELNETENLGLKANQAYKSGDYNLASKYLDEAFQKLRESKKPGGVTPAIVNVPNEYKDFNDKTTLWLDVKLAEWKPTEIKPMDFAVYDVFSSDDMFVKSNQEFDLKFLNILEKTNANIIVLYIRPNNYISQKERYDTLIKTIRTGGKKLFIGARFDNTPMDLNKYEQELTDYTKNIIASIKPDYYGILIEPSTMETKHSFTASDEEWIATVEKISELSKQLSPNTKTAVAGHKQELNFLQLASNINNVDIIGFNIYDMSGIYAEYSGYLGNGDVVGKTIDYANSKGKETWILETWVMDVTASKDKQVMGSHEFMKTIDSKWIQVITYYGQMHNMKVITPFFTGKFVEYTDDSSLFISSLNNNEHTQVYTSFKNLIQEFKVQ